MIDLSSWKAGGQRYIIFNIIYGITECLWENLTCIYHIFIESELHVCVFTPFSRHIEIGLAMRKRKLKQNVEHEKIYI